MTIRLLHTITRQFHCFPTRLDTRVPRYAILSHTWEHDDENIKFQTFQSMVRHAEARRQAASPALSKILHFCNLAARDGFEYAWVDTCCIDKENEGELSEAINSMFRWYQESASCYVYLADVSSGDRLAMPASAFRKSRWFTRGWTLQELVAPKAVRFYTRDWNYLSDKPSLSGIIADITGIDEHVLRTGDFHSASVAMRLSWASSRSTSRLEDQAYCLFGLFDVFLPPLYGEREGAFQRLLWEIANTNKDQSIFSWAGDGRPCGMIPVSPAQYIPSKDASAVNPIIRNSTFSLTNRGVRLNAPLIALPLRNMYAMVLNCLSTVSSPASPHNFVVHFLYRLYDDHNDYVRVYSDQIAHMPASLKVTQPSLLKATDVFVNKPLRRGFAINNTVTFCLKSYPFVSSRAGPSVLGPSNMVSHFSAIPQRPGQPHIITMQLDDQMPSTVMLFKNDAGQQIAVCLTIWGDKIKVGLSADLATDDLSQIADAFLFGKIPMVFKQPGNFSTQAAPRRGKKVTLSLSEPARHTSMGTVCDVNLAADKGFWLHAMGPGVLPGCWTRYFDSLARAKPVKQRTGFFGRKTAPPRAQIAM